MLITSIANEKVKNIRKLRNRKFREESGVCFIEGARIVIEALESKALLKEIIVTPQYAILQIGQKIVEQAKTKKINLMEVSEDVFKSISQKEGPQGIGALVRVQIGTFEDLKKEFSGVWVALYEVADPGNLGTIVRTIDATGAQGLILIGNCTDPYDPTALRASMGAIFSRELVKITEEQFIDWVKNNAITIIGTADAESNDFRECRYPDDMVLLMGSEREGLPTKISELCMSVVSLPMKGVCDSLNLAVATGVMLYEILFQHTLKES